MPEGVPKRVAGEGAALTGEDYSYVQLAENGTLGVPLESVENVTPIAETVSIETSEVREAAVGEVKERLRRHSTAPAAETVRSGGSESVVESLSRNIDTAANQREHALDDLFASIDIPQEGDDIYTRAQLVKEETEGTRNKAKTVEAALVGESYYNERKRDSFITKAMISGGAALGASSLAAVGAGLSGTTIAGFAGGQLAAMIMAGGIAGIAAPVVAAGVGWWAGMKLVHSYKERKHRKQFEKIFESPR